MKLKHLSLFFLVAALVPVIGFAGPNDTINLGKKIYNDTDLSLNMNQSCETCHHPKAGFADPENAMMPAHLPVSDGSDAAFFGGRNAPSAAYAGFSPRFHYDAAESLFIGGVFWDGRASGIDVTATGDLGSGPTGDPMADQAKGPFGNSVEMALPNGGSGELESFFYSTILGSEYSKKFEKECGKNISDAAAYNCAANAIAAFERSNQVNKFTSRFDQFLAEQGGDVSLFGIDTITGVYVGPPAGFASAVFTYDEADGLAIFNALSIDPDDPTVTNGGQCNLCHLTQNHVVDAFHPVYAPGAVFNPMLTDFTYDNLGIPVNEQIAVLAGPQPLDKGLGGQTGILDEAYSNAGYTGPYPGANGLEGAFKVSSLRGLAATAPYGHNGYFPNMTSIVQFYNTRDVYPCPSPLNGKIVATPTELVLGNIPGYPQDADNGYCWDVPEFADTMNGDELGNLGLTSIQVDKLVLFMNTLTDQ